MKGLEKINECFPELEELMHGFIKKIRQSELQEAQLLHEERMNFNPYLFVL